MIQVRWKAFSFVMRQCAFPTKFSFLHRECINLQKGRVSDRMFMSINVFRLGGSVAEWLDRWTCNSEAQSSSPALTAIWICSL